MQFKAIKTNYGPIISGVIYHEMHDPMIFRFLIDTGAAITSLSSVEFLTQVDDTFDLKKLPSEDLIGVGGTQNGYFLSDVELYFLSVENDELILAKKLDRVCIIDLPYSLLGMDIIGNSCSFFHNSSSVYLELKEH